MKQVSVREAKSQLSRLLQEVAAGQDVVITRSGRPVAKLVTLEEGRPILGTDQGRFVVPEDFDTPLNKDLLRAFEGRC